ncbi:protein deltex [Anopheles nili]|uniref:protein deltex n=1 Tax=Anopheles nili TaxID=185578 RepID=UPI00237B2BCA|nr:protein deltex [Anopheles nili]
MSPPSHRVVVWEHEAPAVRSWLPYSPAVTQLLERAYGKNLTRVLLKDADPSLALYEVNLVQMQQSVSGASSVKNVAVRRCLYPASSPAALGIKWEWQSVLGKGGWNRYPLDIQSLIEQAWSNGEPMIDLEETAVGKPYLIDFTCMTYLNKSNGTVNHVRRKKQAPYPLLKVALPTDAIACQPMGQSSGQAQPARSSTHAGATSRSHRNTCHQLPDAGYMQQQPQQPQQQGKLTQILSNIFGSKSQHTQQLTDYPQQQQQQQQQQQPQPSLVLKTTPGPSTSAIGSQHTSINGQQCHQVASQQSIQHNRFGMSSGSRSAQLHHCMVPGLETMRSLQLEQSVSSHRQQFSGGGSDAASSHKGRRPSVDTVSTYLSHESQTSSRHHLDSSEFDVLNCSMGSDEVFMPSSLGQTGSQDQPRHSCVQRPPEPAHPDDVRQQHEALVRGAHGPDPFSPLLPLAHASSDTLEIVGMTRESKAIAKFVHVADPPRWPHAQPCPMCLEELRPGKQKVNVALTRCKHLMHLDCLNMLLVKQRRAASQKNYYIECPTCMSVYGVKFGNQPVGSMSWQLLPGGLPGYPQTGIYEITYNISSGVQGPRHPNPGLAFFAVGFPRRCYLPNTTLGAKILYYLRVAFYRGLLFTIGRSATTGIEDVVLWTSVEHKTQISMYPDPQYLERCLQQLVHLGVAD